MCSEIIPSWETQELAYKIGNMLVNNDDYDCSIVVPISLY